MGSTIQIIHSLLPARCTQNAVIVERGAEKPASFRCWRVGPSLQCERILEYDVKLLNTHTDQIKVVCNSSNTMILLEFRCHAHRSSFGRGISQHKTSFFT